MICLFQMRKDFVQLERLSVMQRKVVGQKGLELIDACREVMCLVVVEAYLTFIKRSRATARQTMLHYSFYGQLLAKEGIWSVLYAPRISVITMWTE